MQKTRSIAIYTILIATISLLSSSVFADIILPGSLNSSLQVIKRLFITADGTQSGNPIADINTGGKIIFYGRVEDRNGNKYLTGEFDPLYSSSVAAQINGIDINNRNAASNWVITNSGNYYTKSQIDSMGFSPTWIKSGTTLNYMSGNVGIGTTNPLQKLHINGNLRIAADDSHYVELKQGYTNGQPLSMTFSKPGTELGSYLQIEQSHPIYGFLLRKEVTTGSYSWGGQGIDTNGNYSLSAGGLAIDTVFYRGNFGSESMRIKGNGNVGIGTSTPSTQLEIASGSKKLSFNTDTSSIASNSSEILLQAGGQNIFKGLDGWTSTWTDAVPTTFFQLGRTGGNTAFTSLSGSSFNRLLFSSYNFLFSNAVGGITPSTNFFQLDYNGNNLFSIQPGGNVGIGTGNPQYKLDIASSAIRIASTGDNTLLRFENTNTSRPGSNYTVGLMKNGTYNRLVIKPAQANPNAVIFSVSQYDDTHAYGSYFEFYGRGSPMSTNSENLRLVIGNPGGTHATSDAIIDTTANGTGVVRNIHIRPGGQNYPFLASFTTAGRIGIGGNPNPSQKLELSGGNMNILSSGSGYMLSGALSLTRSLNQLQIGVSSIFTSLGFFTNGLERLSIDTNGNVGIGTTSPSSKLEVAGDIELPATGGVLLGAPNTQGTWKITTSGGNLSFQVYTGGVWVEKNTIAP